MPSGDYVFRDNGSGSLGFVGKFEDFYQAVEDPWGQSGRDPENSLYYMHSRARLLGLVRRLTDRRPVYGIEIGCGHGHVVAALTHLNRESVWKGMDISPSAVGRADLNYPDLMFYIGDITVKPVNPDYWESAFDVVILGQMLWYVLHKMDNVVERCFDMLKPYGFFIISQAYLIGEQRYGKEIADGFAGTVKLFLDKYSDKLQLIEASYDDTEKYGHHDGLIAFRRKND